MEKQGRLGHLRGTSAQERSYEVMMMRFGWREAKVPHLEGRVKVRRKSWVDGDTLCLSVSTQILQVW